MSYGTNTSGNLIYELADGNNSYFFHYGSTFYDNSQIYFSSDYNLDRIELRYGRAGINNPFCNLATTKYIDLGDVCSPYLAFTERYIDDCTDLTAGIAFVKLGAFKSVTNQSSPSPFCKPQSIDFFEETTSCSLGKIKYAIEYSLSNIGLYKELLPYGEHDTNFSFTPSNIPGLNPDGQIYIKIRKAEFQSQIPSDYVGGIVTYDIIDCSPNLIPELTITYNETCHGDNDGSVTLTFEDDVAEGFLMRYFLYQGTHPGNPNETELKANDPTFPGTTKQTISDPLLTLTSNANGYSGTATDLSGSSIASNGSTLNYADYFIVYQEVDYSKNPVEIKSGGITPNTFRISRPSEISISIPPQNITQPSCAGEKGSVTLVGQGGGFPTNENISLEYGIQGDDNSWDSNPTFFNLEPGNYTFLARSPTGCLSLPSEQITITAPPSLSFEDPNPGITSSSNSNDGVISILYNGGTPNYTFGLVKENETTLEFETIANPNLIQSSLNKTVEFQELGIGTYRITITDSNGCNLTSENIAVTTIPPPQIADQQLNQIVCPNGNDGSITITISGGVLNYNYQWTINGVVSPIQTTGNQTISLNNLSEPGEYILKVASTGFTEFDDPSGYDSTTITLNTPEEVIINSATPNNISCLGAHDGSISVTASGGSSYEYKLDFFGPWTPLNNGTIPITRGGFYDIYIRNQNNCESDPVLGILISEPDELTVSTTTQNATTNGGNQGSITLTIVGGTPFSEPADPYTITWTREGQPFTLSTGSTSTNLVNLEAGEYIAQITDVNDCSPLSNPPIVIDQPGPLGITSLTPTPVLCRGQATGSITAVVTGVAPFNYIWERQDGQPITSPNAATIANLAEGIYFLRLTDASGDPEVTDTVTITEPLETLDATVVSTVVSCYGGNDGNIQITALGGTAPYEYAIDGGFGFQVSDTFNDLAPRTYVVTIRDYNLCEFTTTVEIIEPLQISVTETISDVSSTGGSDGSIILEVSGGTEPYAYSWTGPGITIPRTTKDIDVLVTGNYTVEITSPGNLGGIDGCYHSQTFFLPEPGPLSINNITPTDVSCFGEASGSIATTVTGEGTITYEWTFADGSQILIGNGTDGPNISGIVAGGYMLTVTDINTTTSSAPIIINQPTEALSITNVITTDISCFEGVSGSIQIEALGGTGDYTYSLDGITYRNSPIFNGLAQGNFTAYVRDSNNCDFISPNPVMINEPQELSFVIDLQQPLSAANAADGAITITAFGGTGTLSYSWTGPTNFTPINSNVLENLPGGDYLVTIIDENYALNNGAGCILVSQQPITIAEPGQLIVSLNQTVFLECNDDDFAEITANVQGGVAPYTFEWFRTENGNDIQLVEDTEIIGNLTAGAYFVRVTDTNTINVDATSVIIDQPDLLEITENSITDVLCNGAETGSIAISVQGGTLPYTYEWSNGAVTEDLSNIAAGEYSVLIFDDNGCLAESTYIVGTPADPLQIVDTTLMDVSEYQANDGSIALEISGGSEPYTIAWTRISDGQNMGDQSTISNLATDSYEVLITDANGCTATEIYEVAQPDIVQETITQPSCSGENDGSIEIVVNQGNGTFTYSWNNGASTNNITNLAPGNYSVIINGFGNGALTRTYVVEEPIPLEVNLGQDRTLCAGQELVLNATVDHTNATYNWTSDNGFSSSKPSVTINESGNYSVIVSNQNGCSATGSVFVDVSDDEINAEFAVSSQVFVGESLIAVDISYPLPETQEWILPEGATILKQDSDEAEMVFNTPGEYEIGIMTRIGECFANQTKKVLVIENEVLTEGDGQADPRKLIQDFIIYPNPTDGKFTADIALSERGNISIKIFNFANNAFMASKKDRGEASYSIPFDISGLPSGVYAVLLETPYGNSLRKVILK
ncbi:MULTISPECIES: T9SS type A sorting domain-containing protein [Arenibacter]|uniref:T9SS type A sorting domain-containing protein n=1 Tax=Arenibacter TaxID=178469 RepID=UPI00186407FF|nr:MULTISPECIES: T9SS type A sorting domain-containing protein [Arenibacter]